MVVAIVQQLQFNYLFSHKDTAMAKAFILAALLAMACCTSVVSSASLSASNVKANQTGTWVDLFQPPYNSGPTIIMALSCNTRWSCYVPGGSNGVGFEMYMFQGVANGEFTQLKMANPPMMMLSIALGGSTTNPGGVVAGIGFGNGVQYPVNNVTFAPATTPELIAPSQDSRVSADGKNVLVINSGPNAVLFSTNSGKDYVMRKIDAKPIANCTFSRYGAMIDANTWYVTMGSWPKQSSNSASHFELSNRVSVSRCPKTGKISRNVRKFLKAGDVGSSASSSASSSNSAYSIYTAQIVKTTDGGVTWTTQFEQATNFYFNAIDCLTPTHCVAVGEGMDANAGVHIYRTLDGTNWHQVYFKASTSTMTLSLDSLRVNEHGHFFAAGGYETQSSAGSIILTSADGGQTWDAENSLPNIVDIMSLSFTPGGYGFASAMTTYDTSTILRYDPLNPGPTPPEPSPTPLFRQMQCKGANCSTDCVNFTFPAQGCLSFNSGGSELISCGESSASRQLFNSVDCTGVNVTYTMPLNVCQAGLQGGTFENFCFRGVLDRLGEWRSRTPLQV